MPTGSEVSRSYAELARALGFEIEQHAQSSKLLKTRRDAFQEELVAAAKDLGATYLPELKEAALAEAERRTGFRGFSRMDPLKALPRERNALGREIVAIDADERYVRREYLVGPNGSVTRQLAETVDLLAPWEQACKKFEVLPGFNELFDEGYDTPAYPNRWWEPTYWRRWKQGDAICDTLGLADFGDDVRPAYLEVRTPRDKWRSQLADQEKKRDEIHAVVQRRDFVAHRMANLEAIYLDECRQALGNHLASADPQLLAEWAGDDRGVLIGLRRVSGLAAKVRYHDEMIEGLTQRASTLHRRVREWEERSRKFASGKRPYRTYPESAMYTKGHESIAKLRSSRAKLVLASDKVVSYDRYDRFDLQNDRALWWVEMTGHTPHRLMATSSDWYTRSPDAAVAHIDAHHDLVADAVGDRSFDSLGDVS